jgi:ABC-type transporter Mla maintaining outer membrane lipid asymmetry ATPase subunit MlaF
VKLHVRRNQGAPVSGEAKNFIEIENLHFAYGSNQVLKGVQFSVPRGKVVGILGVSGAGKSTILKLIGGQLRPDQGRCASMARWCTSWTTMASTRCAGAWA